MGDLNTVVQSIINLPPAVILALGALLIPALPKRLRSPWFILLPVLALTFLWFLPVIQLSDYCIVAWNYADYSIMPYVSDNLSRLFSTAFLVVLITGGLFSWHNTDSGEKIATLFYASGAVGVVLAGDYLTLFIFWEVMAIASTWLIWGCGDVESGDVGMRYLLYHVLGGGLLLAGILVEVMNTGSIQLQSFAGLSGSDLLSNPGVLLILLGVAVNAAFPPFHTWLSDAYPKASITGAVFMSALTTKSAIYVLIRLFPGMDILVWIGLIMAIYGTIFALMSNDFRQILSYSILAQLGYMVTAIGVGSEMALNGATAHAFSHILYKSLLFMTGGALLYSVGTNRLSDLGATLKEATDQDPKFASQSRWLFGFYMIGALSISGLPLLNGFISKPMIIEAIGEAHYEIAMLILIAASIGTFLHTGLKIPYYTWFTRDSRSGSKPLKQSLNSKASFGEIPVNMNLGMGIGATLCLVFGIAPVIVYDLLPYNVIYEPFRAYPIAESLLTLSGAFFIFIWMKSRLLTPGVLRDLDTPLRATLPWIRQVFVDFPWAIFEKAEEIVLAFTRMVIKTVRNPLAWLQPYSSEEESTSTHSTEAFTPAIEIVIGLILFTSLVLGLFLIF